MKKSSNVRLLFAISCLEGGERGERREGRKKGERREGRKKGERREGGEREQEQRKKREAGGVGVKRNEKEEVKVGKEEWGKER